MKVSTLGTILMMLGLSATGSARGEPSTFPVWVGFTVTRGMGDTHVAPNLSIYPYAPPEYYHQVKRVDLLTAQHKVEVDEALKNISALIKTELSKIATSERETKLLERIETLERQVSELRSPPPKTLPTKTKSPSKAITSK